MLISLWGQINSRWTLCLEIILSLDTALMTFLSLFREHLEDRSKYDSINAAKDGVGVSTSLPRLHWVIYIPLFSWCSHQGFSRIKLGYILGDITRVLRHTGIFVIRLFVSKMNWSRISMITKSHSSFVYPIWKKEGHRGTALFLMWKSKLSNKKNAFMGHVNCEGSFRNMERRVSWELRHFFYWNKDVKFPTY